MKVVFPKAEEELIDFQNKCKLKDSEVMLCLRYSVVFDKEVQKSWKRPTLISQRKLVNKTSANNCFLTIWGPSEDSQVQDLLPSC